MFPQIIQAPMAGVQDHRLAAAVSQHGGLGSMPFAMLALQAMHQELKAYRSLTQQAVNVNFFCHAMPAKDDARQNAWVDKLKPYCQAVGIERPDAEVALRLPFDETSMQVIAQWLPEVVSFHFGLPQPHFVQAIKALGLKIISSATTLEEALYLQEHGADAVIAQGVEAGGHRANFLSDDLNTQLPTFTLLKQLTPRLRVPVIAAGGLGSAADVRAALQLGASSVQIGTAFLLCEEATTSAVHRLALEKSQEALRHSRDDLPYTALTNIFTGRPARGLVNRCMRELGAINEQAPKFPYAAAASSALRAAYEKQNKDDFTPLWMGQNLLAAQKLSAAQVLDRLRGDNASK